MRAYLQRHFQKRQAHLAELLSQYDTAKERLVGLFSGLAAEAGARDPEQLGRQLAALYDGVAVAARLDADRAVAAEAARIAAETLIEAATRKPTAPRRRSAGR